MAYEASPDIRNRKENFTMENIKRLCGDKFISLVCVPN